MELRLGSVWLLLSCSLQQSLWGILASVPQTHGKKCPQSLSGGDSRSEMKRVQMIKRIPARCSGWDEAWSWVTTRDCRTKYVLDYFDIPSEVQKSVDGDTECTDGDTQAAESSDFDPTDEKFLAIAFASATVALVILIVVIVVSLLRKGSSRCGSVCDAGQGYSSANTGERERLDEQHTCNDYVDDVKSVEPEYEEIPDRNHGKQKQANLIYRYENTPSSNGYGKDQEMGDITAGGGIVPSAPREEDVHQHTETTVSPAVTADHNKVPIQTYTRTGLDNSINNTNGDIKLSSIKGSNEGSNEDKLNQDDTHVKSGCEEKKDSKDGDNINRIIENDYTIFEELVTNYKAQPVSTENSIPLAILEPSPDIASPATGLDPMSETIAAPIDILEPDNGSVFPLHNACESTPAASLCSPTRLESPETETLVSTVHSYEELDPNTQGATGSGYESLLSYGGQSGDTC